MIDYYTSNYQCEIAPRPPFLDVPDQTHQTEDRGACIRPKNNTPAEVAHPLLSLWDGIHVTGNSLRAMTRGAGPGVMRLPINRGR